MGKSGQKMEQTGDVIEERILDGRPLTTYAQFAHIHLNNNGIVPSRKAA